VLETERGVAVEQDEKSSPTWVDGTYVLTLAYQIPLLTPANRCTMSAAPATNREFGGENATADRAGGG